MNKIKVLLFFLIISSSALQAQDIDTLQAELEDIEVVGYEGNRSIMETPGSVSFVDAELIGSYDESSLLYGLNTVPGVRMEQRAPGSYRVSIRGSSLRAPFGVRNVKIYWNGIPFTEPSGSTPLNLLDVINMQNVEVIRGPAGSIYGAGNGGALLLESRRSDQPQIETGGMLGSYGLQKYTLHYKNKYENGNLLFNYANQHSDGYREQSFFNRETAELSGRFALNSNQIIKTSFLYSDLYYGIPGGLNKSQYENDPSQARPGNSFALGSVESNASIIQEMFLAGMSHDIQFNDWISNLTTVYGTFSAFENPFNLDYKKDSRKTGGGRTRFYFDTEVGDIRTRFTAGGEYQASNYAARNFGNDYGKADTLNFDDEIKIESGLTFAKAEFDFPKELYLTAGLSYNYLRYDLNRIVTKEEGDQPGEVQKTFEPEIIPRIGLAKKFGKDLTIHGSVSYGFSPPTIEEFRTNEGSINTDLEAEEGANFELGFRGNALENRFSFDLTGFFFKLEETIVQQQSDRGTVLFNNAGNTDQFGIEAATNWILLNQPDGFLNELSWKFSYTWHHFRFKNYIEDGNDYSGNELTGVAPNVVVTSLDAKTEPGLYATLSYNFNDEIPLNDANTVYSDPYHLVQTRVGIKRTLFEKFSADLYLGIDNLLDEKYSLGYDINAFGDRYYQPAAPRNWFAGIKVNYQL